MTKQLKKVTFTFRLTEELSKQIEQKANDLGITKNAYITMTINKAIKEDK